VADLERRGRKDKVPLRSEVRPGMVNGSVEGLFGKKVFVDQIKIVAQQLINV